ncbi:unnamed protein product [Brassica napus]|uniref:(rape) hypothetical protein n=1 Tax=Brassica napus TaxID=3708 RepID=A0A816YEW8_BRANA|nr:unnamed protein product [Brassica napus]
MVARLHVRVTKHTNRIYLQTSTNHPVLCGTSIQTDQPSEERVSRNGSRKPNHTGPANIFNFTL